MPTITYPNSKIVFTDINGNTGTTILPNSITTPSISTSSFLLLNGKGETGTILSTTGSNLQWISSGSNSNSTTISSDINTTTISNANTITSTNLNTPTISITNPITNTLTFNTPPTSSNPTTSSQLATKEYVDKILPERFINLYLNKSVPGFLSNYSALQTTTTTQTNQTTTTITGSANSKTLIGSFISDPINITKLPICIWNLYIWGTINNLTDPTNYVADFQLYRSGNFINLGTSNNSANHIATTANTIPYKYNINISLSSEIQTNLDDRIVIKLYAYKVSGPTASQIVTTYFEQNYYSYAQIQVITPITLFRPNPLFGTIANSNLYMTLPASGTAEITSTENYTITCPSNTLTIGGPTIYIGNSVPAPTTINLLSPGSTGSIYVNKRIILSYSPRLPGDGQIGETITYKTLASTPTFTSNSPLSITYPLNKGVWIVNANSGFLTVTSGNVSNMSIYIKNGSTFICRNDYSMQYTSPINAVQVLSCSGVIDILSSTTITLFQEMTFSSGTYRIANADFNYSVQFARVA